MPQATLWFSRPFRDWIGRAEVTLQWEGHLSLRHALDRLAAEYPSFRSHVAPHLDQDTFNNLAAVILNGDFLALDSEIPDGATVNVFTPLAGGLARREHPPAQSSPHVPVFCAVRKIGDTPG